MPQENLKDVVDALRAALKGIGDNIQFYRKSKQVNYIMWYNVIIYMFL